ncbi:hypothetical protein [Pengzhenrongella sp.]|jgi:hypothetical protein|uniref:hypothetical protein n=1 Tax=Pengzhenrongella sp. TaxID=2888820 RepID=UPI002F92E581
MNLRRTKRWTALTALVAVVTLALTGCAVTYQESDDGHWVRSRVRPQDDTPLTRHR